VESAERLAFLLFVAAIVAMLARRIRLPYTVGLVLVGILFALVPGGFTLHLTRNLIFSAFLPPLIFEASHQMKWSDMRRELPVTGTLATLGVLLSAGAMAAGMHYLLGWPWDISALVGVLLSATDPVAVVALFRDFRIGGRLRMQVESESLLNDGTAAVLFAVALAAMGGGSMSAGAIAGSFLLTVAGGIACGGAIAWIALLLAGRTDDHLVEITFTTIAAYASFLVAEHLHCSGVLATMTAGIVLGNVGSLGAVSDRGRDVVESFWEYIGYVANSLIFLLIGMGVGNQNFDGSSWTAIAIVIGLTLAGRALAVYPTCLLFLRSANKVSIGHQHVLFWGGLRGALALALVLGLPEDVPRRELILTVVFAAVAFSILVQGITVGPLLRKWNVTESVNE
jgi:CPA1 family monovalent cation:H+ antiporter